MKKKRLKIKIFKQGIEIAEKSVEGIAGVVMYIPNPSVIRKVIHIGDLVIREVIHKHFMQIGIWVYITTPVIPSCF